MVEEKGLLEVKDILNEEKIQLILERWIGEDSNKSWNFEAGEVKPAMDGIAGFMGEHLKAVLHVDLEGKKKKVHLFLKRLPMYNKDKAKFMDKQHFFEREKLMFNVWEEISGDSDDPKPCCVKAYIYTDSMIVMPDLTAEGYTSTNYLYTLDLEHILVVSATIARFHAGLVNYETKKSIDQKRPYNTFEEYGYMLIETMCESKWLNTVSKVSVSMLKAFSSKDYGNLADLESQLRSKLAEACATLTVYKDTLNVLLHRDPWANNIMFNYENNVPVNAVLVDYQLIRYGPPAFDLMLLLNLTTDRNFREKRENEVFDYYYSLFVNYLNEDSKARLEGLGYDKEKFLSWCERARMFGMLVTLAIYPIVLMDPKTAQSTFDDPETFDKNLFEDRSEPVLAYANTNEIYKQRNLAIIEEFIERYVLMQI